MKHSASFALCSLLFLVALLNISCGASRKLQTITVSQQSADAKDSLKGQVSFHATSTFTQPPLPMQLHSSEISWCIGGRTETLNSSGHCMGNTIPFANIDQNGVAECLPQSQGTFVVIAGTILSPHAGSRRAIEGFWRGSVELPVID